jgi:hypothetical protein
VLSLWAVAVGLCTMVCIGVVVFLFVEDMHKQTSTDSYSLSSRAVRYLLQICLLFVLLSLVQPSFLILFFIISYN